MLSTTTKLHGFLGRYDIIFTLALSEKKNADQKYQLVIIIDA